jgi:hypothetical protein
MWVDELAVELVEADAVGAGDDEVEHGPAEREAARLAGEAADHLRPALHLAEAALEQVRRPPDAPVLERIAKVGSQSFEVVGEAGCCGGVAGVGELADERAQLVLAVLLRAGLVEGTPVGGLDPLALALGQLGEDVPQSMHGAALAVGGRPIRFTEPTPPSRPLASAYPRVPAISAPEAGYPLRFSSRAVLVVAFRLGAWSFFDPWSAAFASCCRVPEYDRPSAQAVS